MVFWQGVSCFFWLDRGGWCAGLWGWFCSYQLALCFFMMCVRVCVCFWDAWFICCVWAGVANLGGGLCRLRLEEVGFFLEFNVGPLGWIEFSLQFEEIQIGLDHCWSWWVVEILFRLWGRYLVARRLAASLVVQFGGTIYENILLVATLR